MKETIYLSDFRSFIFDDIDEYFEEKVIGKEYCYIMNLGNNYCVRIFSSIDERNKKSRKDNDSIKLHIFNQSNNKIIKSVSHTKRTSGYKNRLKKKLNKLINCPECENNSIRVGNSEYGDYYFCSNCDHTESIEQ